MVAKVIPKVKGTKAERHRINMFDNYLVINALREVLNLDPIPGTGGQPKKRKPDA